MQKFEPLEPGGIYHIYNRGNNSEKIFLNDENRRYFLEKAWKYLPPVCEIYAYCLCGNHFHFLVRIKDPLPSFVGPDGVTVKILNPSTQWGHLFNAYAQAFNKQNKRTGVLFETPFERKRVDNEAYFTWLIWYIHFNPENHGLTHDYKRWAGSSYAGLLSNEPTCLERATVFDWFGGRDGFINFHTRQHDGPRGSQELAIEKD